VTSLSRASSLFFNKKKKQKKKKSKIEKEKKRKEKLLMSKAFHNSMDNRAGLIIGSTDQAYFVYKEF